MKSLVFFTALLLGLAASAAADSEIPSVTVTASAQTSESAAIHDVLRAAPGVTVLSQGGSQTDLSIRGSSFSGAGLALGGLTLRNPQTEHFHAELPLPAAMLSRPAIRTGLANQGGHLTGTADFDLLPISGRQQFEAGFGTDRHDWQSALIQSPFSGPAGIGLFAGRESASGRDFPDNTLDREFAGGHLQYSEHEVQADLLAAWQRKEFGARGFYGVNEALPAIEKTEDTLLYLALRKGDLQNDYLRAGASWRQFDDDYQLPTLLYRNQHRSRTSSVFADGRTLEINGWALGWRVDAEEERLASHHLGFHHRTRGGVSLLPRWRGDRLCITAGARGEFFTGESSKILPQTGIEFAISDHLSAFAAYTETVRLPSYTELNYNSPGSLGNTGLGPQLEQQAEMGFKGIPSEFADWKATVFHRRSEHTIDWMKGSADGRWQAVDIGTVRTSGTEIETGWYPVRQLEIHLGYTWLYKDRTTEDAGFYASRYALDYPEHRLHASILWMPVPSVEVGTVQAIRKQTRNAVRRSSGTGTESSLVVRFTPPQAPFATLSLLMANLWDDDFETFAGQRAPGRYAGLSLSLAW